jgi:alkylated DNA repair dioxygenase AlkB
MPVKRASAKKYTSNPISGMGDLFGEPELPAGFRYIPDVISTADEKSLVQRFEKLPLKPFEFHGHQGNRRIYTFGHRYVFAGQEPRADASIPDYLLPLTDVASQISGVPADAFEQLMVTEYAPGAGIGWHRDRPSYEDIVAVSFLAPCTLRLRRRVGGGLGAPVRACRTTIGVFAPWPGAGQLAAQHRTDGRSALLRDLAYVSPWPNLLERLAFRDCGCQIGEVIRQSVRGDGAVASAPSRNHDSALSRGHQATANLGPVSPTVA